jgi:3-phenylpropionate/trans-cinnamate dioxygenase ferredoxin reductase subunit
MADPPTFVIAGAGLAGAKAAEALRDDGYDGKIVILGEERARPYERPPLSKDYLRGEFQGDAPYVHEAGFYAEREIELRTGTRAVAVRPRDREVELEGGERIRFDRLLLATGAVPRRLAVPGADLDGVHYLRTVEDADALRARIRAAGRAVVVGAGWIGAEVAASARQLGIEVVLLEIDEVPLRRVLGPELGAIYRDIHVEHGVRFLGGTGVERIEGVTSVERVVTSDGRVLDCDLVVVGVGVTPRAELAAEAGLDVENGILVSDRLESSVPGIFAAGDVANAWHPLLERRIRVEHWATALNQGPAAARNMLGRDVPYDAVPYFFSDQYDVGMEYAGHATEWDRVVFRGDPATREFIAFWTKDGRVVAGMNVNVWDVTDDIQALVRSRSVVDPRRLADPDVPIRELVPA